MQNQHIFQEPLSRPAYLILSRLRKRSDHAVGLCEAIEQIEDQIIEPGTLYRVLAHLEQRGWIEGLPAEGPLRRYRITALGMLALENAEAGRQREQSRARGRLAWLRGKEIIMRLVIWMLRLYPPGWRERYEAEIVALLEQHEITFFTVVDLLVGALDARLDPHYRRARPLVPLRRLQVSWRLMVSAFVAFLFMLAFWVLSGNDIEPASLNQAVEAHSPAVATAILNITGVLALHSLFFFFVAFVAWVVWQTKKKLWNLLRLFPIAWLILLVFVAHSLTDLQLDVWLIVFIATLAEGCGVMLTPGKRWIEEECGGSQLNDLERLMFAWLVGAPALLVTVSMALVCIADVAWMVGIWDLFPLLSVTSLYIQSELIAALGVMVLATLIALFALVHGSLAFKAMHFDPLKQEPLRYAHKQG
jgi:DNA-binding PadR family transcriptional regulator